MTYAMWGIVVGLVFMFGVSLLQQYRRSLMRMREIRWLDDTMYRTGCASSSDGSPRERDHDLELCRQVAR
jgi:hypothetical protein